MNLPNLTLLISDTTISWCAGVHWGFSAPSGLPVGSLDTLAEGREGGGAGSPEAVLTCISYLLSRTPATLPPGLVALAASVRPRNHDCTGDSGTRGSCRYWASYGEVFTRQNIGNVSCVVV